MRQYFHRLLIAILGRDAAARFVHQIDIAFAKSESARRHLLGAGPIISQRQQSQDLE